MNNCRATLCILVATCLILLVGACSSSEQVAEDVIVTPPTATPASTATPAPTATREPTATPIPSPTPPLPERVNSIADLPSYPGAIAYEYNGSLLAYIPWALRAAENASDPDSGFDEVSLVTLPEETTHEDVVAYYEDIGLDGESNDVTNSYQWRRFGEDEKIELYIVFGYFRQEDKENGPSLLIELQRYDD